MDREVSIDLTMATVHVTATMSKSTKLRLFLLQIIFRFAIWVGGFYGVDFHTLEDDK